MLTDRPDANSHEIAEAVVNHILDDLGGLPGFCADDWREPLYQSSREIVDGYFPAPGEDM